MKPKRDNGYVEITCQGLEFPKKYLGKGWKFVTHEKRSKTKSERSLFDGIYRESDGFWYFEQLRAGCYTAHNLKTIAAELDRLNRKLRE